MRRIGFLSSFLLLGACQLPPTQNELDRARREGASRAYLEASRAAEAQRRQQAEEMRRRDEALRTQRAEAERAAAEREAILRRERDAALAARQAPESRRPTYQVIEAGVVGCSVPTVLDDVRSPDALTDEQWRQAMTRGGCYPTVPEVQWAEMHRERNRIFLQIVQERGDRSPPILLWFRDQDVRPTGAVSVSVPMPQYRLLMP